MSVKEMLLKEATSGKYARAKIFPYVGACPSEYLQWLKYCPPHWDVDKLFDKKLSEMSDSEFAAMKFVKKERSLISSFESFIAQDKPTSKVVCDVYNFMSEISIEEYAELKLLPEEIEYCNARINLLWEEHGIDEAFKIASSKESDDIKDNYILFRLRILKAAKAGAKSDLVRAKTYSQVVHMSRVMKHFEKPNVD